MVLTRLAVLLATSLADWTKCLLAAGLVVLEEASRQALQSADVCLATMVAAERTYRIRVRLDCQKVTISPRYACPYSSGTVEWPINRQECGGVEWVQLYRWTPLQLIFKDKCSSWIKYMYPYIDRQFCFFKASNEFICFFSVKRSVFSLTDRQNPGRFF